MKERAFWKWLVMLLVLLAIAANGFAESPGTENEGINGRFRDCGYLFATDYFPADGVTDVSDALQQLIDENPNRTIFFPDGDYLIWKTDLYARVFRPECVLAAF